MAKPQVCVYVLSYIFCTINSPHLHRLYTDCTLHDHANTDNKSGMQNTQTKPHLSVIDQRSSTKRAIVL